jgi:hypothetical protein
MRNLKGGVCYEMAIGDVELDEGPLNIIMAYLLKATGPRELDQVIAGRVSLGHSVHTSSPHRGRHGRGEAEAGPAARAP